MDGLLVDTEQADFRSWQEVFQTHGAELDLEWWSHSVGTHLGTDIYELLEARAGRPVDRDAIRGPRRERLLELVHAGLEPMPGFDELAAVVAEGGYRRGLATSADQEWTAMILDGMGLRSWFHAIATGDDVPAVKPQPYVYQLAAQRLGVPPERCLALEDSRNGCLAARAAGMRCLVVPNAITRGLDFTEAHGIHASLHEVAQWLKARKTGDT